MKVQKKPRLVSLADLAADTGLTERTVRRLVAEGELIGHKVGRRAIRVDLASYEAWLERTCVPATLRADH